MIAAEKTDGAVPKPTSDGSLVTVKVYTRHTHSCAKRDRPDWARCHCVKWLYIYRNGKDKFDQRQDPQVGKSGTKSPRTP